MSIIEDEGPRPGRIKKFGGHRIVRLTLLAGMVVAVVAVLLVQVKTCVQKGEAVQPPAAIVPAGPLVGEAPSSNGPVAVFALGLGVDEKGARIRAGALLKAFNALHQAGRIVKAKVRGFEAQEAPRAADELARRFNTGEALTVTPFEWADLLLGAARALDLSVRPAVLVGVHHGEASLASMVFAVLVEIGEESLCLDPWGGVAGGADRCRALTPGHHKALGMGLEAFALAEAEAHKEAAQRVRDALSLHPTQAALQILSGQIKVNSGMPEFGVEEIAKAVRASDTAFAHYALGLAHLANQSLFKAHTELQAATKADDRFAEAWVALAYLQLQRLEMTPRDQKDAVVASVDAALQKAAATDPDVEGLAIAKAQVFLLTGDETKASDVLRTEIKRRPERPDPHVMLGQLSLQTGQYAEAMEHLENAALRAPTRGDIRELYGVATSGAGDWTRAMAVLTKVLERAPDDETVRLQLAAAMREAGRSDSARVILEQQAKRFEKDVLAPLLLAQLALEGKDFATAADWAQKARAREDVIEGCLLGFLALRGLGRMDDAFALIDQFERKEPNAYALAAQGLLQQGEMSAAEALLVRLRERKPDDPNAPVMLAMAYQALGRKDEVAVLRRQVINGVPEAERALLEKRFDEQLQRVDAMVSAGETK